MSDEREGLPPPSLPLRVRVRPGPRWAAGRGGGEEAPRGGASAHLVRHGPPFPPPWSPPARGGPAPAGGADPGGGRKVSLWKPVWVTFGPNTITVAVLSRDEERMTADGMPSGDGIAVTQPSWPFSVPRRTERLGHVSLAFTSCPLCLWWFRGRRSTKERWWWAWRPRGDLHISLRELCAIARRRPRVVVVPARVVRAYWGRPSSLSASVTKGDRPGNPCKSGVSGGWWGRARAGGRFCR